jgi:N-acetylglucosamine kinase-like BadF-type ATPase
MPLVIGVHAGGSTTVAVAACDGEIVGTAAGEGANLRVNGVVGAAETIADMTVEALGGQQPDALFVGAAGGEDVDLADGLRLTLAKRFARSSVGVSDDARIALRAAVPDGDGAVVVAGTGSIVYAEIGEKSYRGGGNGYLLGDEGSGYAIGNAAVRLLLHTYDGRAEREPLSERIEEKLRASDAQRVVASVSRLQTPVRVLAALAPLVLTAAERGERGAMKILQVAALDLFELLRATLKRCDAADRHLRVALAGEMLSSNSSLRCLLETRVMNEMPRLELLKCMPSPEYGALALARALLDR